MAVTAMEASRLSPSEVGDAHRLASSGLTVAIVVTRFFFLVSEVLETDCRLRIADC
jgi:hypothetical protein